MLQDLFRGNLGLQSSLSHLASLLHQSVCLTGLPPVILSLAKDLSVLPNLHLDTGNGLVQNSLLQLTFPDNDDKPALGLQLAPDLLVSLLVPGHLCCPKVSVGHGDSVVLTALVAVPEAAVNKDDSMVFGEDDVWSSRQTFIIDAIPEAQTPESMAQLYLRGSILGSVMGHALISLLWSHWDIDYNTNLRRFS